MAALPSSEISPGFHYVHHPHHRNGHKGKSQWIIPPRAEEASFSQALKQGWLRATEGWGLHTPSQSPKYLGSVQNQSFRVFVAKFVREKTVGRWHGYPADHQRCSQDIPDEAALQLWIEMKLLTPAKVRKIARGQRCNL